MAIAFAYRSSIYSTTGATSYVTSPTYTPAAGSLLIAFVTASLAASPTDPGAHSRSQYVYPTDAEIVKDSAGLYHFDLVFASPGDYKYRWEGTGAVAAVEEGLLSVRRTYFP